MKFIISQCTIASLSKGWMPKTSRSFHYWQPAPTWRLLPWLANPGNTAMSPQTGRGNRRSSQWINNGNREGRGGENYLDDKLQLLTTLQSTRKNASNEEHMEFRRMRICKKTLTTWERWLLFVVNSVKLHLTAVKLTYLFLSVPLISHFTCGVTIIQFFARLTILLTSMSPNPW